MMYFDVKTTNLQEVMEVLLIYHDADVTMLQKGLKTHFVSTYSS